MHIRSRQFWDVASGLTVVLLLYGVGLLGFATSTASAAEFTTRQLAMSSSTTGGSANYTLAFSGQSAGVIQSIRLQMCTNDPFPGSPCTAPVGFTFGSASLTSQVGMAGFTIHPSSTANELILTRALPLATIPGMVSYSLSNVHSPSSGGTVFGRLETFASSDATGPHHDAAGLAVSYQQSGLSIRTEVPPYLVFCVANTIQAQDCSTAQGNYIDFGEFSSSKTSTGQTQIVAATNADHGFTIAVQGTTMMSGINAITQLSSPSVSRTGNSQFGINLRANSTPSEGQDPQGLGLSAVVSARYNQPNSYAFNSGDVLVSATNPDMSKYTVSYVVNIAKSQAPGVYVSTLTYIAVASF